MILSYIRTVILYLVLILVIRLMGKRQIGEMEPAEFVVTMLVANLAAIPMQDAGIPLLTGLIPILTVLGVELVLSWLMLCSGPLRRLFCGKPVLLIDNGRLLQGNLRLTRVTLDELMEELRLKGVTDLNTVRYAILETNGQLSTLLYAKDQPASARDAGQKVQEVELPITVISDGKLLSTNLAKTGKDENWVNAELRKRNCTQKDTLLLTVDSAGKVFFVRKKEQN